MNPIYLMFNYKYIRKIEVILTEASFWQDIKEIIPEI